VSRRSDRDPVTSYGLWKVERLSNVLRVLDLVDERALEEWLAQSWVVDSYVEFAQVELDAAQATAKAAMAAGQGLPPLGGTSQHAFKLSKAVSALRTSHVRFLAPEPDKTSWMPDDHAVRFVTRLVRDGRAPGRPWASFHGDEHVRALCEKALWVMIWLQWLHRPTGGSGKEQTRLKKVKGQWLKLLHDLREQRTHSLALPQASTLPPQSQPAVTQIAQQLQARPDKLPPAGDNISSSSFIL